MRPYDKSAAVAAVHAAVAARQVALLPPPAVAGRSISDGSGGSGKKRRPAHLDPHAFGRTASGEVAAAAAITPQPAGRQPPLLQRLLAFVSGRPVGGGDVTNSGVPSPPTPPRSIHDAGRVLTKATIGVSNGGQDDGDGNLIIRAGDIFVSPRSRATFRVVDLLGSGSFGTVVKCEVVAVAGGAAAAAAEAPTALPHAEPTSRPAGAQALLAAGTGEDTAAARALRVSAESGVTSGSGLSLSDVDSEGAPRHRRRHRSDSFGDDDGSDGDAGRRRRSAAASSGESDGSDGDGGAPRVRRRQRSESEVDLDDTDAPPVPTSTGDGSPSGSLSFVGLNLPRAAGGVSSRLSTVDETLTSARSEASRSDVTSSVGSGSVDRRGSLGADDGSTRRHRQRRSTAASSSAGSTDTSGGGGGGVAGAMLSQAHSEATSERPLIVGLLGHGHSRSRSRSTSPLGGAVSSVAADAAALAASGASGDGTPDERQSAATRALRRERALLDLEEGAAAVQPASATAALRAPVAALPPRRDAESKPHSASITPSLPSPLLAVGSIVAVKVVRNHPAYHSQGSLEIHILTLLRREREEAARRRGRPASRPGSAAGQPGAATPDASTADCYGTEAVVQLLDHFTHASHLCLVFEYLPLTLLDVLSRNRYAGLPLTIVREVTRQLLFALHRIHSAGLCHADLKLENVMIGPGSAAAVSVAPTRAHAPSAAAAAIPQPSGGAALPRPPPPLSSWDAPPSSGPQVRLIDFGSSGFEGTLTFPYIQSRFYRAPEAMLGCAYDCAIDMWSLGCVTAELFGGLPLFPGANELDTLYRIICMLGPPPQWMVEAGHKAAAVFVSTAAVPPPHSAMPGWPAGAAAAAAGDRAPGGMWSGAGAVDTSWPRGVDSGLPPAHLIEARHMRRAHSDGEVSRPHTHGSGGGGAPAGPYLAAFDGGSGGVAPMSHTDAPGAAAGAAAGGVPPQHGAAAAARHRTSSISTDTWRSGYSVGSGAARGTGAPAAATGGAGLAAIGHKTSWASQSTGDRSGGSGTGTPELSRSSRGQSFADDSAFTIAGASGGGSEVPPVAGLPSSSPSSVAPPPPPAAPAASGASVTEQLLALAMEVEARAHQLPPRAFMPLLPLYTTAPPAGSPQPQPQLHPLAAEAALATISATSPSAPHLAHAIPTFPYRLKTPEEAAVAEGRGVVRGSQYYPAATLTELVMQVSPRRGLLHLLGATRPPTANTSAAPSRSRSTVDAMSRSTPTSARAPGGDGGERGAAVVVALHGAMPSSPQRTLLWPPAQLRWTAALQDAIRAAVAALPPPRSVSPAPTPRLPLNPWALLDATAIATAATPATVAGAPTGLSSEDVAQRTLFADFLARLLVWDPRARMTPAQALLHPFILGLEDFGGAVCRGIGSYHPPVLEPADLVSHALLSSGLDVATLRELARADALIRHRRDATFATNARRLRGPLAVAALGSPMSHNVGVAAPTVTMAMPTWPGGEGGPALGMPPLLPLPLWLGAAAGDGDPRAGTYGQPILMGWPPGAPFDGTGMWAAASGGMPLQPWAGGGASVAQWPAMVAALSTAASSGMAVPSYSHLPPLQPQQRQRGFSEALPHRTMPAALPLPAPPAYFHPMGDDGMRGGETAGWGDSSGGTAPPLRDRGWSGQSSHGGAPGSWVSGRPDASGGEVGAATVPASRTSPLKAPPAYDVRGGGILAPPSVYGLLSSSQSSGDGDAMAHDSSIAPRMAAEGDWRMHAHAMHPPPHPDGDSGRAGGWRPVVDERHESPARRTAGEAWGAHHAAGPHAWGGGSLRDPGAAAAAAFATGYGAPRAGEGGGTRGQRELRRANTLSAIPVAATFPVAMATAGGGVPAPGMAPLMPAAAMRLRSGGSNGGSGASGGPTPHTTAGANPYVSASAMAAAVAATAAYGVAVGLHSPPSAGHGGGSVVAGASPRHGDGAPPAPAPLQLGGMHRGAGEAPPPLTRRGSSRLSSGVASGGSGGAAGSGGHAWPHGGAGPGTPTGTTAPLAPDGSGPWPGAASSSQPRLRAWSGAGSVGDRSMPHSPAAFGMEGSPRLPMPGSGPGAAGGSSGIASFTLPASAGYGGGGSGGGRARGDSGSFPLASGDTGAFLIPPPASHGARTPYGGMSPQHSPRQIAAPLSARGPGARQPTTPGHHSGGGGYHAASGDAYAAGSSPGFGAHHAALPPAARDSPYSSHHAAGAGMWGGGGAVSTLASPHRTHDVAPHWPPPPAAATAGFHAGEYSVGASDGSSRPGAARVGGEESAWLMPASPVHTASGAPPPSLPVRGYPLGPSAAPTHASPHHRSAGVEAGGSSHAGAFSPFAMAGHAGGMWSGAPARSVPALWQEAESGAVDAGGESAESADGVRDAVSGWRVSPRGSDAASYRSGGGGGGSMARGGVAAVAPSPVSLSSHLDNDDSGSWTGTGLSGAGYGLPGPRGRAWSGVSSHSGAHGGGGGGGGVAYSSSGYGAGSILNAGIVGADASPVARLEHELPPAPPAAGGGGSGGVWAMAARFGWGGSGSEGPQYRGAAGGGR